MNDFLNFDDTYTKTALVLGVTGTNFKTDDGNQIDQSKVTIYAELSGEMGSGGTGTQMLWGLSSNAVSVKNGGRQFPAMVELKIRKGARGLGKEVEEIVDFKYLQAVRVVPVEAAKKAA